MNIPMIYSYGTDDTCGIYGYYYNVSEEYLVGTWEMIGNSTWRTTQTVMKNHQCVVRTKEKPLYNMTLGRYAIVMTTHPQARYTTQAFSHSLFFNKDINQYGWGVIRFHRAAYLVDNITYEFRTMWGEDEISVANISYQTTFRTKKVIPIFTLYYLNKTGSTYYYRFIIYVETHNLKLDSSCTITPEHFELIDDKKQRLFNIFLTYAHLRLYKIYQEDIGVTSEVFISPDNIEAWFAQLPNWEGKRAIAGQATAYLRFRDSAMGYHFAEVVNGTAIEESKAEYQPPEVKITYIQELMKTLGGIFRSLHLPVMGDFFEGLGSTLSQLITSFSHWIPVILGIYGIFLMFLLLKSARSFDFSPLMNHFFTLYQFIISTFGIFLRMFWGIISTLTRLPVIGWIAAAGILAAATLIGLNIILG